MPCGARAAARYRGRVRGMLTTIGRVLRDHWPALLAWYVAGTLGHYWAIELAGVVGAYTDVGGVLLQPFAPLAKLISYVAMLLVVRDGLRHLGVLAPRPDDPRERRRDFGRALLGGIVPFVAFYTAYSYLAEDFKAVVLRTLERRREHAFEHIDFLDLASSGDPREWDFVAGELLITPLSIGIVVAAFILRWVLGREAMKKHRWLAPVTVYLESLWVVLTAQILSGLIGILGGWVQTRMAMVWLADLRAWAVDVLFPVVWAWDGLMWLIGEVGGVMLLPLAWLAVTGSIYGYAVKASAPALSGVRVEKAAERYRRLRSPARRALRDLWSQFADRFTPIWNAVVLMLRAGPLLIGFFVLLFALLGLFGEVVEWAMTRLIGPHELDDFWGVYGDAIFLIPALIIEPIRIALVAAGYDETLRRLTPVEAAKERAAEELAAEELAAEDRAADQSSENRRNGGNMAGSSSMSLTSTSAQNGPSASSGTRNSTEPSNGPTTS